MLLYGKSIDIRIYKICIINLNLTFVMELNFIDQVIYTIPLNFQSCNFRIFLSKLTLASQKTWVCLGINPKYFLFFNKNFQSSFRFITKLSERQGDFLYTTYPHTYIVSPITSIPHQSVMFVITDEPPMTHDYHSKSIVYIRIHLQWYLLWVWTNV